MSINNLQSRQEKCIHINKSPPKKCIANYMYKRKIEQTLSLWKSTKGHKPLVIKGCRQCGKTSSVLDFAHRNYRHVIYLDFHEHKEYKAFFAGALDVDTLTLTISAGIRGAKFEPGNTCLVLDEIQDSPNARSSLKFFKLESALSQYPHN